jgi:hypothetical protein
VTPRRSTYLGLFFVTLATITYEILLTRIFSVQFYYHFAFVAISMAMFGMSVGALVVYARPNLFRAEKTGCHLAISAALFSWTMLLAYLIERQIPVKGNFAFSGYAFIAVIYVVVAAPFVFSGISVCLALTRFPKHTAKLYAADLVGAAIGCLAIIIMLRLIDGPSAVAATAAIAAIGAAAFAISETRLTTAAAVVTLIAMAAVAGASSYATRIGKPFMGILYAKNTPENDVMFEKWNHFSRITVSPNLNEVPFGWGLSRAYFPDRPPQKELWLRMDAMAATTITNFDGNFDEVRHLKYDVINSAHFLRPNSHVLVIGTGGDRDILSALAFKQKSVVGVEINQDILNTVNGKYGDFSGHLDRYPNVTFVNDEARSYVTRQKRSFDIIQVSLIDTFAASSAGAFVLTENSLYTTNAWKIFLSKLTDRGILTFSRWYYPGRPAEVYRLTSLATESLLQSGISDPRSHIILLESQYRPGGRGTNLGVGTILVSKEPFTEQDFQAAQQLASNMNYRLLLSPVSSMDPMLARIGSGQDLEGIASTYPLNIHPPDDNKPFFFNVMYLHSLFDPSVANIGNMSHNTYAVYVLAWLAVTVVILTALCIIGPLAVTTDRALLRGSAAKFIYFAGIGFGFMLVEISQMQRLVVFLGHPTYALAVVLFSLLVFSGIGSLSCSKVGKSSAAVSRLVLLMAALMAFGVITVKITTAFAASTTPIRIAVAIALLTPLGFFMGMAFPLGMNWISDHSPELGPWLWGVNGASSVCASVMSMVIAIAYGINASFWTGFSFYALAAGAYVWSSREGKQSTSVITGEPGQGLSQERETETAYA